MTKEMKDKLDEILNQVKDPESDLSISKLGLVKKFRYSEKQQILYVFIDFLSHRPSCKACVGISMLLESKITKDLEEALKNEFPYLSIQFV